MEIRQLITFIKVVQFESFSKAAENLGYSQSAVTVQIRLLEEDLNTRLFDRLGKHITLTAQGQQFQRPGTDPDPGQQRLFCRRHPSGAWRCRHLQPHRFPKRS